MNGRDYAERQAVLTRLATAIAGRRIRIADAVDEVANHAVETGVLGVRVRYLSNGDVYVMTDDATPYGWITEERVDGCGYGDGEPTTGG